ncbi:hypothetical protein E2C01_045705 [Portunus trituberculatus]|uniref:Uncharacterized protein n=1 Tax=Portunus trituberculatus TaxID=210409 RepID=A0A5B7FWH3_PORTR|nr:hypothetical protein [Portunus trituberculatus]
MDEEIKQRRREYNLVFDRHHLTLLHPYSSLGGPSVLLTPTLRNLIFFICLERTFRPRLKQTLPGFVCILSPLPLSLDCALSLAGVWSWLASRFVAAAAKETETNTRRRVPPRLALSRHHHLGQTHRRPRNGITTLLLPPCRVLCHLRFLNHPVASQY